MSRRARVGGLSRHASNRSVGRGLRGAARGQPDRPPDLSGRGGAGSRVHAGPLRRTAPPAPARDRPAAAGPAAHRVPRPRRAAARRTGRAPPRPRPRVRRSPAVGLRHAALRPGQHDRHHERPGRGRARPHGGGPGVGAGDRRRAAGRPAGRGRRLRWRPDRPRAGRRGGRVVPARGRHAGDRGRAGRLALARAQAYVATALDDWGAPDRRDPVTRVAADHLETARVRARFDLCLWAGGSPCRARGRRDEGRRARSRDHRHDAASSPIPTCTRSATPPPSPGRGATHWRWAAAPAASPGRGRPMPSFPVARPARPPFRFRYVHECLSLGRGTR